MGNFCCRNLGFFKRISLGLALFGFSVPTARAELLEVIHTNDLHSFFEHGDELTSGGYAEVKAKIDELKARAEAQGIPVLVLDAGDFSEGTPFYMVDAGKTSWKIMEKMGYDAVALGNHDWLIGLPALDELAGRAMPSVPILSANFYPSGDFKNIKKFIRPFTEFKRGNLNIAVLGLSTDEFVYRWRASDAVIASPESDAGRYVSTLRKRNDAVIALTHLGVAVDHQLIQNVPGIDAVVGGHSHTTLIEPEWERNSEGRAVPIVQAAQHGEYVGEFLVDIQKGLPLKVVHYELHPVSNGPRPGEPEPDKEISAEVTQARQGLEKKYGSQWLYEIVGNSSVPMERPLYQATQWGQFYAQAMQEAARADLSIDIGEFFGETQPAGPITREQLFRFYPRVFDFSQPYGWDVWRIRLPGWLLKLIVEIAHENGLYMNFGGLTFDVVQDGSKSKLKHLKVNGENLNIFKLYKVAVSEGLGLGVADVSFLLRLFFWPKDMHVSIWEAVETKIRAQNNSSSMTDVPALLK